MSDSQENVVAESQTLGVAKSVQSSLAEYVEPMVLREGVEGLRRMDRRVRRTQKASITGGPENVASHDSSGPEAAPDHCKQLMHRSLVEVVEDLRHPDKIKSGGRQLVVAEAARDQQARALPGKPMAGNLLMAGFDGDGILVDPDIPPWVQITDERDAALKWTASDVKQEMVWPQAETSNRLKLIPLQLVPESQRSHHHLKLVASPPTGHERAQSVQLTA